MTERLLASDTALVTGSAASMRGRVLKAVAVCLAIVSLLLCLMFWRLTSGQ